jgi:hypothetical protein
MDTLTVGDDEVAAASAATGAMPATLAQSAWTPLAGPSVHEPHVA